MRIGFCSIYSWRPHVEHLEFLAKLARQAEHETFYLTCDSDFPTCYSQLMRPDRSAWLHCARCRVGGVRSYANGNVASIGSLQARSDPGATIDFRLLASSSASTLGRFESDQDFAGDEFLRLVDRMEPVVRSALLAARNWITKEGLDAIFVFNGRMDATRAVLEAARQLNVRCITVERTWFGDGVQLIPDENCLGLREVSRMVAEWRSIPLTRNQALRAACHVASRFLRRNDKEWRAYNIGAKVAPWPVDGAKRRILLVPGSRNEVWGHPDWKSFWSDRTDAFDAVIAQLGLCPTDVVLRCHPNWGESIGSVSGQRSEDFFTQWARRRGIFTIGSRDPMSTLGLIEQADAVVVCGGSAALEASVIGKQVIAVTPSVYQDAGFQSSACNPDQLATLRLHVDEDPEKRMLLERQIAQQAIRFCYTMVYRFAQFVEFVKCNNTTQYEYLGGADPGRLTALVESGVLAADELTYGSDAKGEMQVLDMIQGRQWSEIASAVEPAPNRPLEPVLRRWQFALVDRVRNAMPRGDL